MQMETRLRKRKRRTKTNQLPEDIIHDEILPRLPQISLLRFRCVCKSWRSLFSDPEFINKVQLIRRQYDQNYLVSDISTSILTILSSSKKTRIDTTTFITNSFLIGSINGLICYARPDVFTLWNPVIRQYKEISTVKLHGSKCEGSNNWNHVRDIHGNCRHLYGFGWDPSGNDYKVVIVCYAMPNSKHGAVYSCNSESWTQLVLPTGIFDVKSRSFIRSPSPGIIVKECPYWSFSRYVTEPGKSYKRLNTFVFKFVAENNEFRLLPDFNLAGNVRLFNLKNCLAGMTFRSPNTYYKRYIDIYSLDHEGSSGVWSKLYTLGAMNFFHLRWEPDPDYYIDPEICEERFVDVFGPSGESNNSYRRLGQVFSYDPKDPKPKRIQDVVDGAPFKTELTYTPSSIFIHGMKHIMHLET